MSSLPPPPPPGYAESWRPPPTTDGQAVAALVCGICGFLCVIPAILAIVLGAVSRKRIDESNGRLGGRGMAVAGIVLGVVWVALSALWLLLVVFADAGNDF